MMYFVFYIIADDDQGMQRGMTSHNTDLVWGDKSAYRTL